MATGTWNAQQYVVFGPYNTNYIMCIFLSDFCGFAEDRICMSVFLIKEVSQSQVLMQCLILVTQGPRLR